MKLFVTGGAGFIGSNFIRYWLNKNQNDKIVCYDLLTYAGNLISLEDLLDDERLTFVKGDIADYDSVMSAMEGCDIVINFAAESHNDRAVLDPGIFVKTNVMGTQVLLEAAKNLGGIRFHHISTCEVFGDLELDSENSFSEDDPFLPRTPYNASKAGANHEVMAYYHTYGLPITISHCANNYGPYQFPEKLIPLFTTNALEGEKLPLFKSSQNKREWIHVDDHNAAVEFILEHGVIGEAYNIGTGIEKSVEEITDVILDTLGKDDSIKIYVEDRLSHDRRYLLDSTKLKNLGWKPVIEFEKGMKDTIDWYVDNPEWWKKVKSGEYQEFYDKYYNL